MIGVDPPCTVPAAGGEAGARHDSVSCRLVQIESRNLAALKDAAAADTAAPVVLAARLFLPRRPRENLPGVVIVHGLGGVKPDRELVYARKLAAAGCAALAIDSFGSRNLAEAPDAWKALRLGTWTLLADAFAGLRQLATHPAVNPGAVSVIGFSWGGMVSVLTAYEQIRALYLHGEDLRFAAHASYYGCSIPRLEDPRTTGAPLLVLLGLRDNNVSVERMVRICRDLRRGGSRVDLHRFDAFHQWDGNDFETRHVSFSLKDMRVVIDRNSEVRSEDSDDVIGGLLSNAWMVLRDVRFDGYDIRRDEAVHRRTDGLLLAFLARVAARQGAAVPDASRVAIGTIGAGAQA